MVHLAIRFNYRIDDSYSRLFEQAFLSETRVSLLN